MLKTKISAMRGKLLKEADYQQLAQQGVEMLGLLRQYPSYGYLTPEPIGLRNRAQVKLVLEISYEADIKKIRRFMSKRQKKQLAERDNQKLNRGIGEMLAYLNQKRAEIKNLQMITEAIYYAEPLEQIQKRLL